MLSDRYKGYLCYAHNGSGYDFRYLIAYLCKRGIPWDGFSAGSRLFLRVADREILDSMAVLPMSLREAAIKLGATCRKQDVPADFYRRIESYDWQSYLIDDCRALYDCITILREAVSALGGQLRRTLASTAIDLWRRHYLDGSYVVPGHKDPAEAAAREAYAGGRCEVLRPSIGAGEYLDINSSYPHAMLSPVPVTPLGCKLGDAIPESGLVYGSYTIPHEEWIPPLFYREAPGCRLYHPTGTWIGWRTADEARYVKRLYGSRAIKVARSIPFQAHELFAGYVKALYKERSRPGPVGVVAKRLLNSLYGRTGMKRERQKIVCGPMPSQPSREISRDLSIWAVDTDSMQHEPTIMPAVAATITARGRIALHKLLREAPAPAYCDTDSVITEGEHPRADSHDLGGVKREAVIISAEFIAPKAYRIVTTDGEKMHAKGLSSRDVDLLRAYLDGREVRVAHVPGIRESIRRGRAVDGRSDYQTRQHTAGGNRHPAGRPYRVDELPSTVDQETVDA